MTKGTAIIFHALSYLTLLLILHGSALGQVPRTVSFQGVLLDDLGNPRPDGDYEVVFALYDSDTSPRVAWTETQSVTVRDGVFSVYLGEINPISVGFEMPFWLGTSVSGEPESVPRIKLTAVPYAFTARAVEDSVISGRKIRDGQVVRSFNGLKDDVTMAEGDNISLEVKDDTLIIAATGGGGGDGHSLDAEGGAETDVVFVDPQGRVGVGTTSPSKRLHVADGDIEIDDDFPFLVLRSSGATKGITFQQADQAQADFFYGNGLGLKAQLTGVATSNWLLATNGNFGIGLVGVDPVEKLDVDGNIRLTGMVVQASDRLLKEDIRGLPYGLNEMLELQPVSYRLKDRQESVRFGLIANDVQAIIPELVRESIEGGGYLGLSYTELIPILIKAIQEQQAEIEDLRVLVSGLRSDLE